MTTRARKVPWKNPAPAIPAFPMIVLMPFTYGVADGAGVISCTVIQATPGRIREIPWPPWVIAPIFVVVCFTIDGIAEPRF